MKSDLFFFVFRFKQNKIVKPIPVLLFILKLYCKKKKKRQLQPNLSFAYVFRLGLSY